MDSLKKKDNLMIRPMGLLILVYWIVFYAPAVAHAEQGTSTSAQPSIVQTIPDSLIDILDKNCLDCHDSEVQKGGLNLELETIDWAQLKHKDLWERVLKVTRDGIMPPVHKNPLSLKERSELLGYLDEHLVKHTSYGASKVRRLSNREYQQTIRTLFDHPRFQLDVGFPADNIHHGFDNQVSGLQLSSALFQSYVNTANYVADLCFKEYPRDYEPIDYRGGPKQCTQTFSSSELSADGKALRLASRHEGSVFRACSWISDLEIKRSGIYEIEISSSMFKPKSDKPMVLEVRARQREASDRTFVPEFRLLKSIEVRGEAPELIKFQATLHDGETLMFRWLNAEFDHTKEALEHAAKKKFSEDKRYHAAWLEVVFPNNKKAPDPFSLRGLNGHLRVQQAYRDPNLDLSDAFLGSQRSDKLFQQFRVGARAQQLFCDTWAHLIFKEGPCLQIHGVRIKGPSRIVDSPAESAQKKRRALLLGAKKEGETEQAYVERFLNRFLPLAFRSSVSQKQKAFYADMVRAELAKGSRNDALHVVLRSILLSPRFLFRDMKGMHPDYALASRLSYFLTNGPPDADLIAAAERGAIQNDEELSRQVKRLLPDEVGHPFVQSFPKQWLNMRSLDFVMPDSSLKFPAKDLDVARREFLYFFHQILKENRPIRDFIDPDFCFTTSSYASRYYKLQGIKKINGYGKIPMPRGHRHGGLLGMSATMIATANGVDTQAVVRGVWFLEHVIGRATPPPPKDVPALTPDIRGAKTPRELLQLHTSDNKCAGCHQMIDPFGFAFENYDAAGKWRDIWPKANKRVESNSKLFDGTVIDGPAGLKSWLLENVDLFAQCFGERLLAYAIGRAPNYREKNEIKTIVENNIARQEGVRDFIIDLVQSRSFRQLNKRLKQKIGTNK